MQILAETKHDTAQRDFAAFYSSELGGIVTEPGFMVIHMDDHMVHRQVGNSTAAAAAMWACRAAAVLTTVGFYQQPVRTSL